jgi:hypothetical protein
MKDLNDVRIIQDGLNTKVFIDGVEVNGLTKLSYDAVVENVPQITISFNPRSINKEAEIVELESTNGDGWRIFDYKQR